MINLGSSTDSPETSAFGSENDKDENINFFFFCITYSFDEIKRSLCEAEGKTIGTPGLLLIFFAKSL